MKKVVLIFTIMLTAAMTHAQPNLETIEQQVDAQQLIYQQEREKALEQQWAPPEQDIRLMDSQKKERGLLFSLESPCFTIQQVKLIGLDKLPKWLPLQHLADQANGRCLGANNINRLMGLLQNNLISHGYITTRVVAPAQDLNSGILSLHIVEGVVRNIRYTQDSSTYAQLYPAIPLRSGQLLDLRAIEQGLENLQQIPTVQASMSLRPGEKPGESDILISRQQKKMWRLALSADDSGTKNTGRYQGNITLSLDNPTSLSDLFYLSLGHDLDKGREYGSKNYTLFYSLPIGYWSLTSIFNRYQYDLRAPTTAGDWVYSGKSHNASFELRRVLHRSHQQKTSAYYMISRRDSRNYMNDLETEIQRRDTSNWKIGIDHRHYIGQAILDLGISYQRGTRWFGAQPVAEEQVGSATALSKILRYSASLNLPFALGQQQFNFRTAYQRQISDTPLTPQERFSIGSRWSVRGFDGEYALSANRGWLVRNDLSWQVLNSNHSLYIGLDYGEVGGAGSADLLGKHLAGGVVGVRGGIWLLNYDAFIGRPLSKPLGYKTDTPTLGFNLVWSY